MKKNSNSNINYTAENSFISFTLILVIRSLRAAVNTNKTRTWKPLQVISRVHYIMASGSIKPPTGETFMTGVLKQEESWFKEHSSQVVCNESDNDRKSTVSSVTLMIWSCSMRSVLLLFYGLFWCGSYETSLAEENHKGKPQSKYRDSYLLLLRKLGWFNVLSWTSGYLTANIW